MTKVFIGVAWPYANGPIHLGHLAGSILPPDIFRRHNLLKGNEVMMVSGSDQHGTPITVTAEREGVTPLEVAERYHAVNKAAIEGMGIGFTLFTKTHTENHIEVTQDVFLTLLRNGHLYAKESMQYRCPDCDRFLPDRYVEGVCPKCSAERVRGDQCEHCGTTFEAGDLIGPVCVTCGSVPDVAPTEHYFLKLSSFEKPLLEYMADKDWWRPNVRAFTENWLKGGLVDRAITRDMDWGVPVPVEGWGDKVIYVWFDAVIGYLSAAKEHSKNVGKPGLWEEYWKDPGVKHYYFLGKDNIPFHSIIWPSMLMGYGGLNLPYDIPANEYLMFRGGKLSKSRGGAIDLPSVLERYDPDLIRFYLSAVMPDTHDSDFSWEDFAVRVNAELVGNLGNYWHRCLSFTYRNFGRIPADLGDNGAVDDRIGESLGEIAGYLDSCDFKKALKAVMDLSRYGNRFFDSAKPWATLKGDRGACGSSLNAALRIAKALAVASWPFMPASAEKIWEYLNIPGAIESAGYGAATEPLAAGAELREPAPVFGKVETEGGTMETEGYEAFRKLDIRVGEIKRVEDHPDADRLYVVTVDTGTERTVVAGLRGHHSKEDMVGRKVLVLVNLKPARIRGVESEGMMLAADDGSLGGSTVCLVEPTGGLPNGARFDCGLGTPDSRVDFKQFQEAVMEMRHCKECGRFAAFVVDGDRAIPLSDGGDARAVVTVGMEEGARVR